MVVRRWGTGSISSSTAPSAGPPRELRTLVWIHGLGEQSASFDPVAQHAALAGFTHVLVDLPGYGRSAWPDAPLSLDALADHLVAWLAARPAVLVGHSMGGVLATLVAERTAVRGVCNIDGNCSRGDCTFSSQALPFSAEDFEAHGFATMRDRLYEAGLADHPLRGYHAAMCVASPRQFHRNAIELVELSDSETLAGRFARLTCAKQFVAGVPRGICEHSRALLDREGASWIGLSPAGHWVFLDQRERFAHELAAFARSAFDGARPLDERGR